MEVVRIVVGVLPARLVDKLLQASFDLIVGEKSHVSWVSHCKAVPVPKQRRPWLQTNTHSSHQHNERPSNESESFCTAVLPVRLIKPPQQIYARKYRPEQQDIKLEEDER